MLNGLLRVIARCTRGVPRLAVLASLLAIPAAARIASAVVPSPTVEGPITGGSGVPSVSSTSFDLAQVGYAQLTVTNSTFYSNSGYGGGISNSGDLAPATLINTILANNFGGNCNGTITDGGHNLDDGTRCGFGRANDSLSSTNPRLDPACLANNGGPTQTIALQAGSPAVNAGDESVCAGPPVTASARKSAILAATRTGGTTVWRAVGA